MDNGTLTSAPHVLCELRQGDGANRTICTALVLAAVLSVFPALRSMTPNVGGESQDRAKIERLTEVLGVPRALTTAVLHWWGGSLRDLEEVLLRRIPSLRMAQLYGA
ncbi:hypothetical protein C8R47DRAFT_1211385 [Mycena vitilis]|nr:hypothetical protein C8R47DRAFT_1211385 [Mycena vitilis]